MRIALICALIAAPLFVASLLLLNRYVATAMLEIEPKPAAGPLQAAAGVNGEAAANGAPDTNAIDTLVLVAKSDAFLGALADALDLAHTAAFASKGDNEQIVREAILDKLRSRLVVARRGATYVIEAGATTSSPQLSAAIANAAAEKIIADQNNARIASSAKEEQDIAGRLDDMRDKVGRADAAVAALRAKLKVTDAGQGSTLLERRVYELNQQSVAAKTRLEEARARYEQMRKAASAGPEARADLSGALQTPALNVMRADYARLSSQAAEQASVLGERHPQLIALQAQTVDLKRQIAAELARMASAAHTDLLEAEQREAAMARQVADAQKESGTLGSQMVMMSQLEREAKAERGIYEQLLGRRHELAETKNLQPSAIRLVSPALPPAVPTPGRMMRAIVCAALGLLAGLAYAAAREMAGDTLTTESQARRRVGEDVAGMAPLVTRGRSDAVRRADLTPWIGALCAASVANAPRRGCVVILVASPRAGAGRSTVAASMAAYLAQGGGRVLLVEADGSSPRKGEFGLLDVLAAGVDPNDAFVRGDIGGYTRLPLGRDLQTPAAEGALMSGLSFDAMLKTCRDEFNFVVIDGPAALEAGHARRLASRTDATVLVVEWGKTAAREAKDALDSLDAREAVLFFNKVNLARFRQFDPARAALLESQGKTVAS